MMPQSNTTGPVDGPGTVADEIRRAESRPWLGGKHGPKRLACLITRLEVGEIDPLGAFSELRPEEAELVRRLALANLRELFLRREET